MPMAPTIITHSGIDALDEIPPVVSASLIAASGPTELATSLAPCAKLNRAAAKISGMVNRELTPCLSLVCFLDLRATQGFAIA